MLVAAGQFAVTSVWEKNAEICASLMAQAAENDVSLFVLPEALLARDDHDADLSVKSAQLLEGEFLGRLRRESKRNMMTTIDDSCSFNAGARMEYAGGATGRKHRRPLCQIASL